MKPIRTAAGAALLAIILGTGCVTTPTTTPPGDSSSAAGTIIESPAMAEQLTRIITSTAAPTSHIHNNLS